MAIKTIVVGTDLGESGHRAMQLAVSTARATRATLWLVHASEVGLEHAWPDLPIGARSAAQALRERLKGLGYVFESDTDTEVIGHLVHHELKSHDSLLAAVQATVKQLEGALEISPQSVFVLSNLGVSYSMLNQHQKSIDTLQKALDLSPANAMVCANLGVAYQRMGQPEEARKYLEKARELNPDLFKRPPGR